MSILDPKFKYMPSHSTDIRKTIKRERKRLKEREQARQNILNLPSKGNANAKKS